MLCAIRCKLMAFIVPIGQPVHQEWVDIEFDCLGGLRMRVRTDARPVDQLRALKFFAVSECLF